MDKSLLIFIAIGIGALYFITNFVGEMQEDDKYQNEAYKKKHQYDQYQSTDSIGRKILDLTDAPIDIQVQAWNDSKLKIEFLKLFPDFSEMKIFVEERVRGDEVKTKLIKLVNTTEDKYFSGVMNEEQAKRLLGTLK